MIIFNNFFLNCSNRKFSFYFQNKVKRGTDHSWIKRRHALTMWKINPHWKIHERRTKRRNERFKILMNYQHEGQASIECFSHPCHCFYQILICTNSIAKQLVNFLFIFWSLWFSKYFFNILFSNSQNWCQHQHRLLLSFFFFSTAVTNK